MEEKLVSALLAICDCQLQNAIKEGATFNWRHRYSRLVGGNKIQNAYYDGHLNAAEATIWAVDPGADIVVDLNGKHSVEWSDRKTA